ncbi:Diacylglycerol lipase-beta [Trichinella spiralis]|uniref:Diacylglycerol lipase-beta n=1 Tax=Trichinella spiralis TaxID=6334 RepID=A0ABR3L2K9_TRISP
MCPDFAVHHLPFNSVRFPNLFIPKRIKFLDRFGGTRCFLSCLSSSSELDLVNMFYKTIVNFIATTLTLSARCFCTDGSHRSLHHSLDDYGLG